ncbi:MAG: DUF3810 domain-containing protein [Bacteroidetes bacterium]|nr:DUF3810 domain-containing protein [Bacteroidota bacterium]
MQYGSGHVDMYNKYLFQPFQLIRIKILKHIPVSIGDVVYISLGIGLLTALIRTVYYAINRSQYADKWKYAIVRLLAGIASVCFWFMIGWGGNYYKQSLTTYWQLEEGHWSDTALKQFDSCLASQLNALATHYKEPNFENVTHKAKDYYATTTDCHKNGKGLYVKPSLFGNLLQYMGVSGYYNPLTGEAQVNDKEPAFMMPYLVSHELAHQTGVAAEDDANLLAYAVCMNSSDTTFMYSACFNLWLYTHMQLRMRDSIAANTIKRGINPLTISHLETLRKLRRKYRSKWGRYTGEMYDQYLKLNHQKEGIESYDKVTVSAWAWLQKDSTKRKGLIRIP